MSIIVSTLYFQCSPPCLLPAPPAPYHLAHANPDRTPALLPFRGRVYPTTPTRWLGQFLTNNGSPVPPPDGGIHLKGKAAEGEEETAGVEGIVNTLVNTRDGGVGSGKKRNIVTTLWEFSRPHTMIGTAIAIPAVGVFAAPPGGSRFRVVWCDRGLVEL